MNWLFIILGLVAFGAVVLAIYEWRTHRRITHDQTPDPTRDPARAAYTKAQAIRAETMAANSPQGGDMF